MNTYMHQVIIAMKKMHKVRGFRGMVQLQVKRECLIRDLSEVEELRKSFQRKGMTRARMME